MISANIEMPIVAIERYNRLALFLHVLNYRLKNDVVSVKIAAVRCISDACMRNYFCEYYNWWSCMQSV